MMAAPLVTRSFDQTTADLWRACWRHYPAAIGVIGSSGMLRALDPVDPAWPVWGRGILRALTTVLRPEPTDSPQEQIEHLRDHVLLRNYLETKRAGMRLLKLLDRPASEVIPDRRPIRVADGVGWRREDDLDLMNYIGMAIQWGDKDAIDSITTWMKTFVTRGPKQEDWPTILRMWRYTAAALDCLSQEWASGVDVAQLRNQELVARLEKAGENVAATLEGNAKSRLNVAKSVVAKEYRVKPSTMVKEWKSRHRHLPSGDRLLE